MGIGTAQKTHRLWLAITVAGLVAISAAYMSAEAAIPVWWFGMAAEIDGIMLEYWQNDNNVASARPTLLDMHSDYNSDLKDCVISVDRLATTETINNIHNVTYVIKLECEKEYGINTHSEITYGGYSADCVQYLDTDHTEEYYDPISGLRSFRTVSPHCEEDTGLNDMVKPYGYDKVYVQKSHDGVFPFPHEFVFVEKTDLEYEDIEPFSYGFNKTACSVALSHSAEANNIGVDIDC